MFVLIVLFCLIFFVDCKSWLIVRCSLFVVCGLLCVFVLYFVRCPLFVVVCRASLLLIVVRCLWPLRVVRGVSWFVCSCLLYGVYVCLCSLLYVVCCCVLFV